MAFMRCTHLTQCLQGFYNFLPPVNTILKSSLNYQNVNNFLRIDFKGGLYRPLPRYGLTLKTASEGICGGTAILPNVYSGFMTFRFTSSLIVFCNIIVAIVTSELQKIFLHFFYTHLKNKSPLYQTLDLLSIAYIA